MPTIILTVEKRILASHKIQDDALGLENLMPKDNVLRCYRVGPTKGSTIEVARWRVPVEIVSGDSFQPRQCMDVDSGVRFPTNVDNAKGELACGFFPGPGVELGMAVRDDRAIGRVGVTRVDLRWLFFFASLLFASGLVRVDSLKGSRRYRTQ